MIIKPDAVKNNHIGSIISHIENEGFTIHQMKHFTFNDELAGRFYGVHKDKTFYEKLIKFMTSGPSVGLHLKREGALELLRRVCGATNPSRAEEGTLRKLYGTDETQNAVHSSDSPETARKEIGLIFG